MIILLALGGWWSLPWLKMHLPPQWNPFTPLAVTDPPGWMTRYKLECLSHDPEACLAVLQRASAQGFVRFRHVPALQGDCSIAQPLRISGFGDITLSGSFLASGPMAISSTMFILNSHHGPQQSGINRSLRRNSHLGSYACRNIYHRQQERLSEHATAEAWDVSGFQLANGRWLRVGKSWQQPDESAVLVEHEF